MVDSKKDWSLEIDDVEVVTGRSFITSEDYRNARPIRVINLCKSYRYQSVGYYVSLLASARGFRPAPAVNTIQDMRSPAIVRLVSGELGDLVQESLAHVSRRSFELDIFFGQCADARCTELSSQLTQIFHTPLMRARFLREDKTWSLAKVSPLPPSTIPAKFRPQVTSAAKSYIAGKNTYAVPAKRAGNFTLAILVSPDDPHPPSNEKAIGHFIKAAAKRQMSAITIQRGDYSRLAEFDALFIRETTAVNHYTYNFASTGASLGLVVIDDPESILKCTNKVFLKELLENHDIPAPRTLLVHRANMAAVARDLGFPLVIKRPDGSFSTGVIKVKDYPEFKEAVTVMLQTSELVIAQEFMATTFDWRVTILGGKPLFVCRYYMADDHWQIVNGSAKGDDRFGLVDCIPIEEAPKKLLALALKSASLIGDGLYGLDIKEHDKKFYLIEINDNPTIDSGFEDRVLKEGLYDRIIDVILKRIIAIKEHYSLEASM